MKQPTFYRDGTPSEETLEAIRTWRIENISGLWDFLLEAWDFKLGEIAVTDKYIHLFDGVSENNALLVLAVNTNPEIGPLLVESDSSAFSHTFYKSRAFVGGGEPEERQTVELNEMSLDLEGNVFIYQADRYLEDISVLSTPETEWEHNQLVCEVGRRLRNIAHRLSFECVGYKISFELPTLGGGTPIKGTAFRLKKF